MVPSVQVHAAQDNTEPNSKLDNGHLTKSEQKHMWSLKCMLIGSAVVLLAVILLCAGLGFTLGADAVQV